MNWYIGQRVVAVKDHSQRLVLKNQEFIVLGVIVCRCGTKKLDIGLRSNMDLQCGHCRCGHKDYRSDKILWMSERLFAPIEPKHELSSTTYEDIMTEIEARELQNA
jgi:hypothetical protein